MSVGRAAMNAPAKCTLYSLTPVLLFTRLFSATVSGNELKSEHDAPNRKSFQMFVNCQITQTTMIGALLGSRMRANTPKKLAPAMRAERISSFANAALWVRNKWVEEPL